MDTWRGRLAIVGGATALLVLLNELYFPYNRSASQFIWDWIADPLAIVVIALMIVVNVRDSLAVRNGPGDHLAQLPRDVITALVAVVLGPFPSCNTPIRSRPTMSRHRGCGGT